VQQLVDENPKRPDIGFGAVDIVDEAFRTHVDRTPDGHIPEGGLGLDGESKVSQFELSVGDEDVGDLDIPVDDAVGGEVAEGLEDREDNLGNGGEGERFGLLEEVVEVASFAELGDDVAVVDAEVDVVKLDDVGVADLAQYGHLALEESSCDLALELSNSDFFDGDGGLMEDVVALVDPAEAAFSDFLL
jgi:hypothetical protein